MQNRFKVGQAVYQDVLAGSQAQQAGEVCDQREGHIIFYRNYEYNNCESYLDTMSHITLQPYKQW